MSASSADTHDDVALVERALDGNEAAIRELRDQHNSHLKARLLRRGASETDAQEILADLWSDCVMGKFRRWQPQAGSSLIAWLSSVATTGSSTISANKSSTPTPSAPTATTRTACRAPATRWRTFRPARPRATPS